MASKRPRTSDTSHPYTVNLPKSDQKNKFKELEGREVKPTLFYDYITCFRLEINDMVRDFARELGFGPFLSNTIPNDWVTTDETYNQPQQPPLTYRTLTLEFVASFELKRTSTEEGDTFEIKFRMFNHNHSMDLVKFNEFFGWDPRAEVFDCSGDMVEGYNMQEWWSRITDGSREFLSNSSKAAEIHHAALRYFHRMLVFPFYSRQDLGKMSDQELHLLWRATEGRRFMNRNDPATKVNLGYLLALRVSTIKNATRMTGPIQLGGMATWLAYKLGYKKQLLAMVPESSGSTLNVDRLKNMKFIKETSEGTFWMIKGTIWCKIPSRFMTNPPQDTANPWRVPFQEVDVSELDPNEIEKRRKARQPQQQQQEHQPQQQPWVGGEQSARRHPSQEEGGTSYSHSSTFNIENAFNNLSLQMANIEANNQGMMLQNSLLFHHFVEQGQIAPPVNYPYWPPCQGPVPSYGPEHTDGTPREPVYPYWQGPSSQIGERRTFPPYDYTQPGGCDYLGDPAYRYTPPEHIQNPLYNGYTGFPPAYYGGWEPHGPPLREDGTPFELDYNWRRPDEDGPSGS